MEINATFLGQAVAFLIFAAICMKYIWPPLTNALARRQKEIADGLAAAEKAKKSLELATSGAAETLRAAKAEAQNIIDGANQQRAAILDRAAEEAQAEKAQIIARARGEIEAERNRVREELRAQVIDLSVRCAEKILEKKVDVKTDRALLDQVLTAL